MIKKVRRLRIFWGLPIPQKNVGKLLIQLLPIIDKVEYADSEGAIFETIPLTDVEWILDLGKELRIKVYFEETGE